MHFLIELAWCQFLITKKTARTAPRSHCVLFNFTVCYQTFHFIVCYDSRISQTIVIIGAVSLRSGLGYIIHGIKMFIYVMHKSKKYLKVILSKSYTRPKLTVYFCFTLPCIDWFLICLNTWVLQQTHAIYLSFKYKSTSWLCKKQSQ